MISSYPCAAAESSPASLQDPSRVTWLLIKLEDLLERRGTGALLLGDASKPRTVVLVEQGRVCWAAAPTLRRRLTTLLGSYGSVPLASEDFEQLYRECRRTGTPIGECLVSRRFVTPHQLRKALLQHSVEALTLAAAADGDISWVPHRKQRYDARFTFTPVDLWVMYGSLLMPELAHAGRKQLQTAVANGGGGCVFSLYQGAAQAIATAGEPIGAISTLLRRAEWAHQALGLVHDGLGARFVGCRTRGGRSAAGAAAWAEGDMHFFVQYDSASAFAYMVAQQCRSGDATLARGRGSVAR